MEYDNYEEVIPTGYAQKAVASPTLSLIYGVEGNTIEEESNQQIIQTPAFVAAERARKVRAENMQMMKDSGAAFAAQGNVAAVEETVKQIQEASIEKPQSFVDDVSTTAAPVLERLMLATGKTAEEIIPLVNTYAAAMSTRAALEVAITSLDERSGLAQFAQDVVGATTIEDWSRASPAINSFNEKLGFKGSNALTAAQAATNFYESLRLVDEADRPKVIKNFTDYLVPIIGEKDARRVLQMVSNVAQTNPALEGAFGALDVLGITALVKGSAKAVLNASRGISVARSIGAEAQAANDLARTLAEGKGVLGATTSEAVDASITSKVMSSGMDGLSSDVQKELQNRVAALIKDLDNSLYTGGANVAEIAATKARLEAIYSQSNNPAIIKSEVSALVEKGRISLDVLYGDGAGKAFKTTDEALAYWKNWKAGDLEVVPVAGKADEIDAIKTSLDTRISSLIKEIGSMSKDKIVAKVVADIKDSGKPTNQLITEVFEKQQKKVPLAKGVETAVGKVIKGSTTVEEAFLKVQQAVPEEAGVKLRQLEEAVAERVSIEMGPPAPGYLVRQKLDVPPFVADIGSITMEELEKMHLTLGKINPRLSSANSIYTPALASSFKKTKLGKGFSDFITKSFDKLNAASIDKVNKALVDTEKLKRDMSSIELDGVGVRTPEEKEAYYAFRTMRNVQHMYKEKAMRDYFTSQGYNHVFIGMDELGQLSGVAKHKSVNSFIGKRVYDVDKKQFTTVTPESLAEMESRGLVGVEYAQGQSLEGVRSSITKVVVPANNMRSGDVMNVVGRVDGAYSRIYEEEFFIQIKGEALIDDVTEKIKYAFRTAASEADADKYARGLNTLIRMGRVTVDDVKKHMSIFEADAEEFAALINSGKFDGAEAVVKYDRLEGNYFRNVMGVGNDDKSGGRVFWSGRSENGLKSISTGSVENVTKGPLESLQAEIANTSNFVSMGEWRRNAIQRWYNTFESVIDDADKLGTSDPEAVFFNVANRAHSAAFDDPQLRRMLAVKDFILSQLGTQTADEMAVQNVLRRLTNSVPFPGFAHVGKLIRKYDVPAFLKSANSTLMLGLFGAAQLVVQASGMALATAVSPKHGLKAAYSVRPILAALTSDNPKVWQWFHKSMDVVTLTGMKKDEFARVAAAIKKVGLVDNIGASSVYNNSDGALNIFSKKARKFNQYQMMFFNKGEEINRVGAFEIARREFIEANPEVLWDSSESLSSIMQRADDLTMNMTRVNEARLTQGWFGIPLQFLQHNIRLGTNVLAALNPFKESPTLSRVEMYKLTLGSYLLYGINNNATPDFIEEALGNELNSSLTDQQKQYLTQGLLAGLLSTIGEAATGERLNVALGARLSSVQWYEDMWDAMYDLFKGEGLDGGAVFGPTGSTLLATLEAPKALYRYISKDEWSGSDFLRTMSLVGASFSTTWRNVDKAYWAFHANGMVMNKKGDATATLTTPEVIAQLIGFSSTESIEANTLFRTETDYRHAMTSYANTIIQYNMLAMKAYVAGDKNAEDINYAAASALLAPLPYADQQYIQRLVKDRTTYDTTLNEAMMKWNAHMSSRQNKFLVNNNFEVPNGE